VKAPRKRAPRPKKGAAGGAARGAGSGAGTAGEAGAANTPGKRKKGENDTTAAAAAGTPAKKSKMTLQAEAEAEAARQAAEDAVPKVKWPTLTALTTFPLTSFRRGLTRRPFFSQPDCLLVVSQCNPTHSPHPPP